MKTFSGKPIRRDRTYRSNDDGDYINSNQYLAIAISLCVTHFFFEIMYIWVGCMPMVLINIVSFFCYVVGIYLVRRGKTLATVWIMVLEVFLHVILATIFMGFNCGYQLWLFGTIASVFLPFYNPDLSKNQRKQIGVFSLVVIGTYMGLTALNNHGVFPTRYNANPEFAKIMYYINALLAFISIMLYTEIYNDRMTAKHRELQQAAEHDFLTGIFNRQRMQRILDAEVLRQQELTETNLSVAIVDIDFFKKVNDTYGHIIGDEALVELTKIFRANAHTGMLYGRWGGEEFLLLAPEEYSYDQFAELLEDIRKQVEAHSFVSDGKTVRYTVSIGAANYEKGMTVENFVDLADDRLYHAKETGRNKTVYA